MTHIDESTMWTVRDPNGRVAAMATTRRDALCALRTLIEDGERGSERYRIHAPAAAVMAWGMGLIR